jgi:hypothetical protein
MTTGSALEKRGTGTRSAMADGTSLAGVRTSVGLRILGGVVGGLAFVVLLLLTSRPAGAATLPAMTRGSGIAAVGATVSSPPEPAPMSLPGHSGRLVPGHSAGTTAGPHGAASALTPAGEAPLPSAASPTPPENVGTRAPLPAVPPLPPVPAPQAPQSLPTGSAWRLLSALPLPVLPSVPTWPLVPPRALRLATVLPGSPGPAVIGFLTTPGRWPPVRPERFTAPAAAAAATDRARSTCPLVWRGLRGNRPAAPLPAPRRPLSPESPLAVLDAAPGSSPHSGVSGTLPPMATLLAVLVVAGVAPDLRRWPARLVDLRFSPPG